MRFVRCWGGLKFPLTVVFVALAGHVVRMGLTIPIHAILGSFAAFSLLPFLCSCAPFYLNVGRNCLFLGISNSCLFFFLLK